jgi:hypothetical protein
MTLGQCTESVAHSKIKVEENGKSAVFLNATNSVFNRIHVDGCVIKDGPRCDWVISRKSIGDVLIELKGSNVKHAFGQIRATAAYWRANKFLEGRMGGLVVCSQYPRIATMVQKAKEEFSREFNAPLRVESRNLEYAFEDLL